jgi:two-component system sensor kinase FixL
MVQRLLKAGKLPVITMLAAMVGLIAAGDRYVGNKASLGVLYILPMVLGATVLSPSAIVVLALLCSTLRALFDIHPTPHVEIVLRFVFATLAYAGSGLFVVALIRIRQSEINHLESIRIEQDRRRDAEEQLNTLVESSPAAILTVAGDGMILAANRATSSLFMLPESETAKGRKIGAFLPVLADALQFDPGPEGLRAAAQCQGRRDNGEIFLANTWFSSYQTQDGMHLTAIVVDSSEEMRDREELSLQQLTQGNRIAAAAAFHEVRNLCGAISVISANLKEKYSIRQDDDLQALASLVNGLEKIASVQLSWRVSEALEEVELQSVLDDLRIVIEPDWHEIGGIIRWRLAATPRVLAERHGLLQAFLNIAHNSHRAVQESAMRELSISAAVTEQKATVRFIDSGPGVAAPERLFAPFQPGADGSGLGLYVSRAVVRSYGGDLRCEPRERGSCFAVDLQIVL